jgi:ribosomal protein S21
VVNVKRKKGESFESLLRRFSRRMQASGKMLQAKKIRFHKDAPSKGTLKKSALRRKRASEKRDYLLRTGRLVEEVRRGGPGSNRF